eukprot:TRINITY_DN15680_c0_g1_i1.p1 TRINITY_DN15680_c0_g1~~TRINITY_DN15680_c0_g1_i1.p1  ORF type:complete len:328 (+),score=25.66 TRINITY_DN15680_c0_g1_i1:55-984(+)
MEPSQPHKIPLLEPDVKDSKSLRRFVRAIPAVVLPVLLIVIMVSELDVEIPSFKSQSSLQNASLTPSSLAANAYTSTCWPWTGGTCKLFGCAAWRHASCTPFGLVKRYCTCSDGCVGADFSCHPVKTNTIVATNVTFSSVRWPNLFLHTPTLMLLTQMRLNKKVDTSASFSLAQVPGTADGLRKYMMSSAAFPSDVVTMTYNIWAVYTKYRMKNLKIGSMLDKGMGDSNGDPLFTFWIVCKPADGEGVQIGIGSHTFDDKYVWAYASSITSRVFGWSQLLYGNPDDRGRWMIHPPDALGDVEPCPEVET